MNLVVAIAPAPQAAAKALQATPITDRKPRRVIGAVGPAPFAPPPAGRAAAAPAGLGEAPGAGPVTPGGFGVAPGAGPAAPVEPGAVPPCEPGWRSPAGGAGALGFFSSVMAQRDS